MKGNFKTKGGIVFNMDDPDQVVMFEHVKKRTNHSAYMKRLIWADIKGLSNPAKNQLYNEETQMDALSFDPEQMMKEM
jgi:hypothetical protein